MFLADGHPLDMTRIQRRALGGILSDPATRSLLGAYGLDLIRDARAYRFRTQSLHRSLGQLWRTLEEAPSWTRRHPLLSQPVLQAALESASILAATAPPEVAMTCEHLAVPLTLVAPPEDATKRLLDLEMAAETAPGQVLRIIDEALLKVTLPADLLERTLLPLLNQAATCAGAARLLGRAKIVAARPSLEAALARTSSAEARLEILGALMRLGDRARAFGTLRSILTHGAPAARSRAVDLLSEVATSDDIEPLFEALRSAHQSERIPLSGLLYRLGDLRAFRHLNQGVDDLSGGSSAREIEGMLDALEAIGSKRFIPCLKRYLSRETRAWFIKRGRSIEHALIATGIDELSVERLIEAAEANTAVFRPVV